MKVKLFGLLVLTMFGCGIQAQQTVPEDTLAYYDFWVGNWVVSWDEGNGVEELGTNRVERILDGRVIQENFEIRRGKNTGFKGTSISVYNPQRKVWKQAWADNQGGYFDFVGETDGDKRIFITAISDRADGRKIQQRMIFHDIKENSMTWDWELSEDGGKSWGLQWRIFYRRSPIE